MRWMMLLFTVALAAICFAGCAPASDEATSDDADNAQAAKDEPAPSAEAYFHPGPIDDERWVLPNGRMIWPAGDALIVDRFAIDLAVRPGGDVIVVTSAGVDKVRLVDAETMTTRQTLNVDQIYTGAVWNAAGDRFWVSGGGSQVVYEFDYLDGVASEARRITVFNYPAGFALSPNERYLYIACLFGKRMAVVDLLAGEEIDSVDTHLYSNDVKITPDGDFAFVSNTGGRSVTVVDLDTREAIADIDVGKNPEGMAIAADGSRLYVANADTDDISVIDLEDDYAVVDTWPLYPAEADIYGVSPVALAVTQDGTRLYAITSGTNEIAVLDTTNGAVLGRIPIAWYGTNLRLDEANNTLYYACGKGYGSYGLGLWSNWRSTFHGLEIPDADALADLTDRHEAAMNWSLDFYDTTPFESPIPLAYGTPSAQIKHVIFILKENKTYDQVLGDLEGTEHDPSLCSFGWDNTPNHHTLAQTFSNCDNLFVEGDVSVQGHMWGTFGMLNDHQEKANFTMDNYPLPDFNDVTRTPNGTIFERLLDAGIEFRSYGQIIGFLEDFYRFTPYIDLKYGFWNMGVDDVVKVDEIIREWEAGIFPPFIYISLPNDHTYGSDEGKPTPQYLLGDNDAALGKLVDWLSHSEHWADTAIFTIEDDPQSGADHIDPHRTIGLVISSWAKRGHVSSVLYSMSSIWHTIELILGIPPASKYSQYAAPMYDCFTMEQDLTPYTGMPNPIPFDVNGKGLPFQDYCAGVDFTTPDQASRMGEVLWAMTKPGVPFPYDQSLSGQGDEDEDEDVKKYRQTVELARRFAAEHGLEFDALPRRK